MNANQPMDATEIAARIRGGELTAVEVVEQSLTTLDRVEPAINSVTFKLADRARRAAEKADQDRANGASLGPLHGVPALVKDVLWMRGVPATDGNSYQRDFVPDKDAIVVERLEAAGAIVVAKTTNPELCAAGDTVSKLFGATRNPWNPERTTGGSSGGSAAAVAAGIAPLALGSDAGGSIRIPASFCGVVGFKPTNGLFPSGPGFGRYSSTSTSGPMTRSVRDAALLTELLSGYDDRDYLSLPLKSISSARAPKSAARPLRVAWSLSLGKHPVSPAISASLMSVVERMLGAGWTVEEATPQLPDLSGEMQDAIYFGEIGAPPGDHAANVDDPSIAAFYERRILARELTSAQRARHHYAAAWGRFFRAYDVLITPTMPITAFPIEGGGPQLDDYSTWDLVVPMNLYRGPAITLPIGLDDGLPIGVQVAGPIMGDATVLDVGAAIEEFGLWDTPYPMD